MQALLYFSNVIKRHWNLRRRGKPHSQFQGCKRIIKDKIASYFNFKTNPSTHTLYDTLGFICLNEYPHNFSQFSKILTNKLQKMDEINKSIVIEFKQMKQIWVKIGQKKGHATIKQFQDQLRKILTITQQIGQKLMDVINKNLDLGLDTNIVKISKYCDQILISILMIAPIELYDQDIQSKLKYCMNKLQQLLTVHRATTMHNKQLLEKNIKSIIYSLLCLESNNPLLLAPIISTYFQTIVYVITNYSYFLKSTTVRYSLLALRKFIRQFSYYSEDSLFFNSIGKGPKAENFMDSRKICKQVYENTMTNQNIEGLMQLLISQLIGVTYQDDNQTFYDFDQTINLDRDKNAIKDITTQQCSLALVEAIIQRFSDLTFNLIKGLLNQCIQNNWENVEIGIQLNILSVLAVLPRRIKQNRYQELFEIPILQILAYIHNNSKLRLKLPSLIIGWIQIFNKEQILALIIVLLEFIKNENKLDLLLHSCQALCKIIERWSGTVDVASIIQKVFPVAVNLFTKTDNPEVLWPMVNLISSLITKTEFDTDIIINSVGNQSLNTLLQNQSAMLIEPLAQMLKNFLCIIPRTRPADAIFQLTYYFLRHHLPATTQPYHQKIVYLWYISIRQYSPIHNCNHLYSTLFKSFYRRIITTKTVTQVYILEEYMLLELSQMSIGEYLSLVVEFFKQAQLLQREQCYDIKTAVLSFYISLLTKYGLEAANNQEMLIGVLKDLCEGNNVNSPAYKNSVQSIVNRYLILYKQQFFQFCHSLSLNDRTFYEAYFRNAQFLTSRTAISINSIALISLINFLSFQMLSEYFQKMIAQIIPGLQSAASNQNQSIVNNIQNSPNLRFASNVLSLRKEQIRKKSGFGDINIIAVFQNQMKKMMEKLNLTSQKIIDSVVDDNLKQGLIKFL